MPTSFARRLRKSAELWVNVTKKEKKKLNATIFILRPMVETPCNYSIGRIQYDASFIMGSQLTTQRNKTAVLLIQCITNTCDMVVHSTP